MSFIFYLLGLLPSFVWLAFYLRKDAHPEPNRLIIKVFLFGAVSAFLAIFAEQWARHLIGSPSQENFLKSAVNIFFGVALIEETLKYLAVRTGVYKNTEFDEPIDVLLYMIIAALGFAAVENILVLSSKEPFLFLLEGLKIMGARAISATFLHALTSAIFGYFIVLSFHRIRYRHLLFFAGLFTAAALHSLYNFFIMNLEDLLVPTIILIASASFISYAIKKVKKLKSVCLIGSYK
jgi:RsiW-degrading membrane proteinase PrsW (M82 family)